MVEDGEITTSFGKPSSFIRSNPYPPFVLKNHVLALSFSNSHSEEEMALQGRDAIWNFPNVNSLEKKIRPCASHVRLSQLLTPRR